MGVGVAVGRKIVDDEMSPPRVTGEGVVGGGVIVVDSVATGCESDKIGVVLEDGVVLEAD